MNLYEKLSAITTDLSAVAKNLTVGEGRAAYKAVGEADVLAAVKPLESKYKVYSYPISRKIIASDILTTTSTFRGETSEKSKMFLRMEVVYRFLNIENPEEFIDITTYGDGIDSQDKAPGKAMTYADKYALLKAYKIITGDDPDQYASEEGKVDKKKKSEKKEPEKSNELTYREKVIITAKEKGISFSELAKDYNLNGKTTEGRFKEVLEDLTDAGRNEG